MDNYELDIRKEVLNDIVSGIHGMCCAREIALQHPSLEGMGAEIHSIRHEIRAAETMEELEIVNEKLMEYHKKLSKIESGEIPVV
jgi:hypothetical protein